MIFNWFNKIKKYTLKTHTMKRSSQFNWKTQSTIFTALFSGGFHWQVQETGKKRNRMNPEINKTKSQTHTQTYEFLFPFMFSIHPHLHHTQYNSFQLRLYKFLLFLFLLLRIITTTTTTTNSSKFQANKIHKKMSNYIFLFSSSFIRRDFSPFSLQHWRT